VAKIPSLHLRVVSAILVLSFLSSTASAGLLKPPVLGDVSFAKQNPKAVEKVDLRLSSRDPRNAEAIYATRHAYDERSAKLAYVNNRVVGAYYSAVHDPNGRSEAEIADIMASAREEAISEVKGKSYRGGFGEALLKDSTEMLIEVATLGRTGLGNTSGLLIEKSLDGLAGAPRNPAIGLEVVAGANAFALEKMKDDTPLGREMRKIVKEFLPDLNSNHELELNPTVAQGKMDLENKEAFSAIGLKLDDLRRDGKKNRAEVLSIVEKRLNEEVGSVKAVLAEMKDDFIKQVEQKRREEAARQKLLAHAENFRSSIGLLSATASLCGDPETARFISQGGQFISAGMTALLSVANFGTDPVGTINSFMQMILAGAGLFGKTSNPQLEMHLEVMKGLKEIKEMLVELGTLIDTRFDALDRSLQSYMRQATEHLKRQDYFLTSNEASTRFLIDGMARIRRETYGNYMLNAGLAWIRLEHDCFPQSQASKQKMDEDLFRLCRNSIAHLSLVGPPSNTRSDALAVGPDILEAVADRLKREYLLPDLDQEVKPNPAAWLSATKLLLQLGATYPHFAHLLQEKDYDYQGFVSPAKISQAGNYYQALMRNMVLVDADGAKPRLRRKSLDAALDQYEAAVRDALINADRMLDRRAPGGFNPKLALEEQEPSGDRNLYQFMNEGIGLCADDIEFLVAGDGENSPPTRPDIPKLKAAWKKHQLQVQWPQAFLGMIPRSVRFAALGLLPGEDQGGAKVTACLRKLDIYEDVKGWYPKDQWVQSTIKLDFDLSVAYRVNGTLKNLVVAKYHLNTVIDEISMWLYGVYGQEAPLRRRWNGEMVEFEGRKYFSDPAKGLANMFKDIVKMEPQAIAEFEADFKAEGRKAGLGIEQDLQNGAASFNRTTLLAREQLSFMIARGLEPATDKIQQLVAAVSNQQNLPDADEWVRARVEAGVSRASLEALLEEKLASVRNLISEVEQESVLRPGINPFGTRIKQLAKVGRPAPA
jgi:hypothetical protein